MNETSPLTSVLLDKSVLREALRAVQRRLSGQTVPERQFLSFSAVAALLEQNIPIFITEQLFHILSQPRASHVARVLLPRLRVLKAGKYLRRWARRLREEGFSREDAVIVSYASFGMDEERGEFGAEVVLTTDYALKTRYERRLMRLSARFHRMTSQLQVPYRDAMLPTVLTPSELLEALLG